MPKEPTDLEVIAKAAPYIRSIAAFIVFLSKRFDARSLRIGHDAEVEQCYTVADDFVRRLKADVTGEKES